jgi:hypothetical protein
MGAFFVCAVYTACGGISDPAQNHYNIDAVTDDIRGVISITELHWAGSVDNDGDYNKPDDCFIELYNGDILPRSMKGWTVRFTDAAGKTLRLITLPEASIPSGGRYTIGRGTDGAFSYFDLCVPNMYIPKAHFRIRVQDPGGRTSDTVDFTKRDYLPGSALPRERRSAVRFINSFNEPRGSGYDDWYVYNNHAAGAQDNIKTCYKSSMFCAPGRAKGATYLW